MPVNALPCEPLIGEFEGHLKSSSLTGLEAAKASAAAVVALVAVRPGDVARRRRAFRGHRLRDQVVEVGSGYEDWTSDCPRNRGLLYATFAS